MIMKEKRNRATYRRPGEDRIIDAPVLLIDVSEYIDQITREETWSINDKNAITIFKTEKIRLLLIGMHKGAEMHTDRPENILVLQLLKGRLFFTSNEKHLTIKRDQVLVVHENIYYSLKATHESFFLLMVSEDV